MGAYGVYSVLSSGKQVIAHSPIFSRRQRELSHSISGHNEMNDRILREEVRLTLQHLPMMQASSFVVGLVLCYAVRDLASLANIITWLSMVLVIALSRVVLYRRFQKVRDGPFAARPWRNACLWLSLVSGLVWGASAIFLFPARNHMLISLFVLVIASLVAATTVSHSPIKLAPAAWSVPAMLPYTVRCLLDGGEIENTISLLTVIYLITILRYSIIQNKTVAASIALKFENLELLAEQKAAAEAKSELAAIVESSDDAIIGKTLDGTVMSWNSAAERLYGYSKEEAMGKHVSFTVPKGAHDDTGMILERIKGEEQIERYETVRSKKNGTLVNISLTVSPIKNESGRIVGAAAIAHDISERKRAESEREKLITELREALSRVKILSGLLPICSSCKKVRDDQGYWNQIETYIKSRAQVEFSHGICPDCARKLYPDLIDENPPPR